MTEKGEIERTRYIIVIESVVCYNFGVADSDKSEFWGHIDYE